MIRAGLCCALILAGACRGQARDSGDLAVTGGTVILHAAEDPLPEHTVLIRDGRVQAVFPDGERPLPAGMPHLDAAGGWVLPGLCDSHVHLASTLTPAGPVVEEVQKLLDGFLVSGVTSVVDLWGTDEIFRLRELERSGAITSPRLFAVGAGLSAPGTHGTQFGHMMPRITSPAEARSRVAALHALEADLVKVALEPRRVRGRWRSSLSPEIFQAITGEAHRRGLEVGVHVLSGTLAARAVRWGADVLVHAFLTSGFDEAALEAAVERGVRLVPTLSVEEPFLRLRDEPEFLEEPFLARAVDPRVLGRFDPSSWRQLAGTLLARAARTYPRAEANVLRLHEAGVTISGGTDAGNLGVFHGPALHREAQLLVRGGLTPAEALEAVTAGAAAVVGRSRDLGTLEPGSLGDLVVLDADPLEDVRNLRCIRAVVKEGRPVDLEACRRRIAGAVVKELPAGPFAAFQGAEPVTATGSLWTGVVETGAGPHSRVALELVEEDGDCFLRIRGELGERPLAKAGAGVHLGVYGLHAVDLSERPILAFEARGDGLFVVELITLDTMEGTFAHAFLAGARWRPVRIDLRRMRSVGVPPEVPCDPGRAMTLRLVTGTNRRGSFRLDVDDVRFERPGAK